MIKKFFKLLTITAFLTAATALTACGKAPDTVLTEVCNVGEIESFDTKALKKYKAIVLTEDTSAVSIHTGEQKAALEAGYEKFLEYAFGREEKSVPEPVVLRWKVLSKYDEPTGIYRLYLADNPEMKDESRITVVGNEYSLKNLEIGKEYYWKIAAEMASGERIVCDAQVLGVKDAAPRVLEAEGVTNLRDVGGWKTIDGKRIKQGKIFRSGRLNENGEETVTVTEDGIRVLTEDLGIKTELDLREGEVRTASALGDSVSYVNIPIPGTITTQLRKHDDSVKRIFELLTDEANYPILIHCSVGTDRTGLVTFILNGLLGVSEDDLYTDYAFSNFAKIGALRKYTEIQQKYVSVIKQFPGNNLSEQTEAYLNEIGITDDMIATIKGIMLEK